MSEEGKPARSGKKSCCLFGCVGVALFVIGGVVLSGVWMGSLASRFGEAQEWRAERETLPAFEPAADGRVPRERLDAYVRIRNRLLGNCTQLQGFFGAVEELERKDRAGEEPGFLDGLGVASAGLQLPGMLADYFEMRNRALVEERMSLDEWRWYTVLAYRSGDGAFLHEGEREAKRDSRGSAGERELARRTLVAQLEAARAAGPEAVGADWIALLEAEAERLDGESPGWPWAEGLPDRLRESMEPQAQDLRVFYCRAAEQFELDEVEQDGVSVKVN